MFRIIPIFQLGDTRKTGTSWPPLFLACLATLVAPFALPAAAAVGAQTRTPVVVELFTSEGCSSCPPADSLLAELAHKQPLPNADLIVLSEHVDYWNSMGWKDPFSAPLFSERQQSYATLLHTNDVYTPQAVIDGRFATVGSNRVNVLKAITTAAESPKPELALNVSRQGDTLVIHAGCSAAGETWIAVTQDKAVSHVEHGENGGRTLQHVGVVRSLTRASNGDARVALNKNWDSDLRVVAFVQDRRTGRILQAAQKQL
jgi:hypothetical protein